MNSSSFPRTSVLGFGVFELDCRTGELRESGELVHLPLQPFKILSLLASHAGEIVTREEIHRQIWGDKTYVDFERGLNQCVSQIRMALGDDAEAPRYIETLPRRGYRFIHPITAPSEDAPSPVETVIPDGPDDIGSTPAVLRVHKAIPTKFFVLGAAAAVLIAAAVVALNVAGLRNRLLGHATAPTIHSIAVLPLENLSRDPDQEYFADGMTEELITDLGKISALRVISRTSVMRYKGTKKPLPEIARELNVDAIVEGTVEHSGNHIRITANLLYAPTDRHLWADSYERNLGDVLSLQDDVARAIARQIRIKLTPREHARLVSARPINPQAQEAYLKGRYFLKKLTPNDTKKAIEYGRQAVQIDPDYAAAYGLLAAAYWQSSHFAFGNLPNREALNESREAAMRALEIDDTVAEAHSMLGTVLYLDDWNWAGAEREYKRAIELNPNFADAAVEYAWYLMAMGRRDDAIREAKRALELDPVSPSANHTMTATYYNSRQYAQAIKQARKWLEIYPDSIPAYYWLFNAFHANGMYDQAIAAWNEHMTLVGKRPEDIATVLHAYKVDGIRGYWRWRLENEKSARQISLWAVAYSYAQLRENDEAIQWLEKMYKQHDPGMPFARVDPLVDPIRSDPRFQDLLRRMNFPPQSGNTKP